jgi:hypothetical protein
MVQQGDVGAAHVPDITYRVSYPICVSCHTVLLRLPEDEDAQQPHMSR